MTQQRMMPRFLTKGQLLAILEDIRTVVANDDSFEGSFSYEFPDDDDPPNGFRVRASYRTGNSMGQGGMRMIGEWVEVES